VNARPHTDRAAPEVSVVIPCFNEADNVVQIHAAVTAEMRLHAKSHEILFIDNASTDGTRELLRQICARDPATRAILNTRNFGQMRSPTHAIYQATGAAVIGMCADFQDPPAMLSAFIAQWRAGAEIVLGQRASERAGLRVRLGRALGYAFLARFADYPIIPGVTGFGLYAREVVDTLARWNEPEPFFRGMLVESGYRIALIAFDRPERAAGKTKNGLRTLADFALSGIAGSAKSLLRVLLLFVGLVGDQVRIVSERTRGTPLVIEAERLNFGADDRTEARSSIYVADTTR